MDLAVSDLHGLARFLSAAEPRIALEQRDAFLKATLPDEGCTLVFEWEPTGVVHVRLPIGVVPPPRIGTAIEVLSDVNSVLGILGFVVHRASGWIELRFSVFADHDGRVATATVGKVVVSMQDTVVHYTPQLQDLCRMEQPAAVPWWVE